MSVALLERWAKRLQSLTVSHLPSDYTRPSPPRLVEAALSRSIDAEVQLSLFRLAIQGTNDSQATTPFTILLSAFIVLVQRLTGDEDISIGTSSEGGDPFVLRCGISPSDSFTDLLRKVKTVDPPYHRSVADVID
jgi:L-aminoadipate-semialdehyde dehydrogenase